MQLEWNTVLSLKNIRVHRFGKNIAKIQFFFYWTMYHVQGFYVYLFLQKHDHWPTTYNYRTAWSKSISLCVQCVTVLSLSLYLTQVRYQSKFNELASWLLLCGYYVLIESETGYTILSRRLWLEWMKYISFACNDLNKHVFTWWFIGCFRRGSLNRLKMSMCSIYKYAQRINFKNTYTML